MKRIEQFVYLLCFIAIGFCCVCSLIFHGSTDFETYLEQDSSYVINGRVHYVGLLLFLIGIMLLLKVTKNLSRRTTVLSVIGSMMVTALLSGWWIANNTYLPQWDQRQVWDGIQNFVHGTYGWVDHWYYKIFTFQMGIVVLFFLPIRFTGFCSVMIFRIVNVIAAVAIDGGMSLLAYKLSRKKSIAVVCGWMLSLFAPLIMYTTFIYGTLISLALIIGSFILLIDYLEKGHMVRLIWVAAMCALANTIYGGTIIASIAIGVICMLHAVRCMRGRLWKDMRMSIFGVTFLLLFSYGLQTVTGAFFTYKTGVPRDEASPASSIVLMGMTSDGDLAVCGPGSYDASTVQLYEDSGESRKVANEEALRRIRIVAGEYAEGKRSLTFFMKKLRNEWSDPWFSAGVMTIYPWLEDQVSPEFQSFCEGPFMRFMQDILSSYLMVIYLLALLSIFLLFHHKDCGEKAGQRQLLLPIYFLGGFVFYLFWESKPRYSFSFFVFLVPLALMGAYRLECFLEKKIDKFTNRYLSNLKSVS